MPLEQPKNLMSAAEMQVVEALKELNRPKHSEFSRYFPRIRGTPARWHGFGKRIRAKQTVKPGYLPSGYDDVKLGLIHFMEWADKFVTRENIVLTSQNVKAQMRYLVNKWCDQTNIRGAERASMRRLLDIELVLLKADFIEHEKTSPIVIAKKEFESKGGFERNKPCWCGSELKFKRCHLGVPVS